MQAVRRVADGEQRAARIAAAHPGAKLRVMQLDLTSQTSIRAFAAEFLAAYGHLNVCSYGPSEP